MTRGRASPETSASSGARRSRARRTLVLDFDGTITEQNTLELAVSQFGDLEAHRRAEGQLGRTLTLEDVIARGYASLRAPRARVAEWLAKETRLRIGFGALVRLADERGWRLLVVSSGVRELIEPVLARERLGQIELVANALDQDSWRVRFRETAVCAYCGEPCKRRAVMDLAGGDEIVYVGDGYSDGCAAEAADRVFARRRLADYLDGRGLEFERFEDFNDVVEALSNEPV